MMVTPKKARHARQGRMSAKALIRSRFGEHSVRESEERLCKNCRHWCEADGCPHDILPLTTKGDDCPYYFLREMEEYDATHYI
jgi:hypothetical protein